METLSTSKEEAVKQRRWFIVDAQDKVLGRLASEIANVLRGKHRVEYTPHVDTGDFVIVVNAAKVKLTGRKEESKIYHHHTSWVGGVISRTAAEVRAAEPEELIKKAVKGMLPKGPLGRDMAKKLKVYAATEHPHEAQKPQQLALN